jgi:hypothetical protein
MSNRRWSNVGNLNPPKIFPPTAWVNPVCLPHCISYYFPLNLFPNSIVDFVLKDPREQEDAKKDETPDYKKE